jgi:hypothetical protein
MRQEELLLLLKKGESPRIEWKQQVNVKGERAKEEFIKDLTAMANTSPGDGYIIYGVQDTGNIIGVPRKKGLEESLQQIACNRSYPPIEFLCEWVEVEGKSLLVVHIPESRLRPHATSRKDVYVRRQKIVDKATPIEIHQMMLRESSKANVSESTSKLIEAFSSGSVAITQFPKYDLHFFPISGAPQTYRVCSKYADFDEPAVCPVFMPHFGIFAPEPEFGNTKSVIYFEWETSHLRVAKDTFRDFLKAIEKKAASMGGEEGVWNCFPMSWSFVRNQEMDYGLGTANACLALDRHSEGGLFGGIIQFERVSVYKPTNFLTLVAEIYPREEEFHLRELAMKVILSSMPLSHDWINSLFDVFEILGHKILLRKPGDDALNEPLYTLHWVPVQSKGTLRPKTLGLFGREKDFETDSKYDMGLGVVIDTKSLQKAKFEIDREDSWQWEWYEKVFEVPPSSGFSELPVQITNPIPTRKDIIAKDFTISVPTMRQVMMGLGGFIVIAINAHSFLIKGQRY